jgi:hypothetical protein
MGKMFSETLRQLNPNNPLMASTDFALLSEVNGKGWANKTLAGSVRVKIAVTNCFLTELHWINPGFQSQNGRASL